MSGLPSHSLASAGGGFFSVITGHFLASSAFSGLNASWPAGSSSSEKIASTGHSGSHSVQSMHSSGIDDQEIRALVEAVDRAHLDAVHVLALDAGLGNDEGHAGSSGGKGADCATRLPGA